MIRFHEEKFFGHDIDCGFNGGKLKLANLDAGLVKQGLIGGRKLIQKSIRDEETPYNVLKKYFEALKEVFPSNWNKEDSFVQSNIGLNVFFILLKQILIHMDIESKDELDRLQSQKFIRYLEPLRNTKFSEELKKVTSSESGRAEYVKQLSEKIDRRFRGFVRG